MNRVLARQFTLSARRPGNLEAAKPDFARHWKHPAGGVSRQILISESCGSVSMPNYWRKRILFGSAGPLVGQVIAYIKFLAWGSVMYFIPYFALSHNNYKRFGDPESAEE